LDGFSEWGVLALAHRVGELVFINGKNGQPSWRLHIKCTNLIKQEKLLFFSQGTIFKVSKKICYVLFINSCEFKISL